MLPISNVYSTLVDTLRANPITLLQAPPGAGKSTWLPLQLIRDEHFRHIVMLEPRRLAARNIANYLAALQHENLGQSIGLRIRQERYVSPQTKLEIVTEGMLTRMLQNDPELNGIDCLIFDEFHERSIVLDTSLAFALEAQETLRDDLKILLMSATLDADKIVANLDCPVITSEGRGFPIEEVYHPLRDDKRWLEEVPVLVRKALDEQTGSCLVFLPGRREIAQVSQQLKGLGNEVRICQLFGDQSKAEQDAAIAPSRNGVRKLVLATNVAETSITLEGIRIVVDSGKRRAAQYNLNTGVTELKTVNTSMSSAIQRAGRAGRIEPGIVYRLGSKETFSRRVSHDIPEMLSSDISSVVLEAKHWGTALDELTLLDHPTLAQKSQAAELLLMLEAVDQQQQITTLGKKMLALGTDIRWAHMLIKAQELEAQLPGIVALSVHLIALLDSRVGGEPELSSRLNAQCHSPHPLFSKQLRFWEKRFKHTVSSQLKMSLLPLVVALAYPDRIAQKRGGGYLMANGAGIDSRPDYWINDDYLAIAELGGQTGKHIFSAISLDIQQLEQALPHLFTKRLLCEFDERKGSFVNERQLMLNAIVVNKTPISEAISEQSRTAAWLKLIQSKGLGLFSCYSNKQADRETNQFHQLLIRMTLAHRYYPEQFPPVDEDFLLSDLDHWLSPYLRDVHTLSQLKKLNLLEPLTSMFDWNQQSKLKSILPMRIQVPSGSNIALIYQLGGPAKLSVRMQEVYGMSSTPRLCDGQLPLLMDLLSPAKRSLQLTLDLEGFWKGSYQAIQKEMKGRYPKHYWPDNPADSKATTKTKAKM